MSLLQLIAFVHDIRKIQIKLPNVCQTNVSRIKEGSQPRVVGTADIEGDFVVELADGDLVELLADEAEVREVGGANDLAWLSARPRIAEYCVRRSASGCCTTFGQVGAK